MKRLPIFLLGLSLVANAALVWKVAASNPATSLPSVASAKPDDSAAASTPSAHSSARALANLRRASNPELVAQLRAAGFNEAVIRSIIHNQLLAQYQAELDSLDDSAQLKGVWWRGVNSNSPERKARLARRQEIMSQLQTEVNAAVGTPARETSPDLRYAFLSADKIAAVKQLEKEYQAVSASASQTGYTGDSRLTIAAEKRADLATILTPQELAEYDLRFSPTAEQMRSRVSMLESTEAEYRTLFALHQTYDRDYPSGLPRNGEQAAAREAASLELRNQIVTALGTERGGDYIWGQNTDYQNIKQASALLALPQTTALEAITLREEISLQGMAIARNSQLSEAEKSAALTALSVTARQRLDTLLPANLQAKIPPRSLNWVTDLANGRVTLTDPLRSSTSSHQIGPPKR